MLVTNINAKKILFFEINVYDDVNVRNKFANVALNYLKLWNDNEFTMKISKNEWMSIELKFDVKIETTKIYSFDFANKKFVNEIFDKLHAQKRMKYIIQFTSHDYSMIVIWRIVFESNDSKRIKRVVVNIRNLNKIIFIDLYFMSFQFDIISIVIEYKFISVFDVANSLYIFRLFKKIKKYIEHCFIDQLTQTKRHKLYEKLMFITFASCSFHIIIIDFILIMFDK